MRQRQPKANDKHRRRTSGGGAVISNGVGASQLVAGLGFDDALRASPAATIQMVGFADQARGHSLAASHSAGAEVRDPAALYGLVALTG